MAHEIDFSNGSAAMAYVGKTPWHGLGHALTAGATIEEWQAAAGMDWKVQRSRVHYAVGADGTDPTLIWGDKHVLFRSDTKAPLGVVSDKYNIVQPGAVLEFFRDLVEDAGFALETAGCLFDGRRFWGLARITGDTAMIDAEDKVGGFLLLSTSADGTLATSARFTSVRVVCNNTLGLAIGARSWLKQKRGEGIYTLSHSGVFEPNAARQHLGLQKPDEVRNGFANAMDGLRRLASTKMTSAAMADATMRLFDHDPSTMTADEITKAAKNKVLSTIGEMAVTGNGLIGAELKGCAGTVWCWLNAVTQYVDHQAGRAGRTAAEQTAAQNRRVDSSWFGPGDTLKRKALQIAQVMADGSVTFAEREQTDDEFNGDILGAVLAATPGG